MSTQRESLTATKIIATLGPATANERMIEQLIRSGVSVFRLNFSHGSLQQHEASLKLVREASEELRQPVAVLGDLSGPKIRLGEVADENGRGGMTIETGDQLVIQREPVEGRVGRVSTNYAQMIGEVEPGHRVLIDDGSVRFLVKEKQGDELVCQCTHGGMLQSRKGVNLPDTELQLASLTDHDRRCAAWAVQHELPWVALSFVRRPEDLQQLRELVGEQIGIIAKIEKPEALRRIDGIIQQSDALMVARGDLGVEMDLAEVPLIQKDLIHRCGEAGRPVIVATQMLQSMIHEASPTRAEASDVANAILDGTDAVMLSGETAVGKYPVLTVQAMRRIIDRTEGFIDIEHPPDKRPIPSLRLREQDAALARGAWQMAHYSEVKLVIVWSQSGAIARIFSKLRIGVPVAALSSDPRVVQRMALFYGIRPLQMDVPQSLVALTPRLEKLLQEHELAAAGDMVLIVAGTELGQPGRSNAIVMHRVGESGQGR